MPTCRSSKVSSFLGLVTGITAEISRVYHQNYDLFYSVRRHSFPGDSLTADETARM